MEGTLSLLFGLASWITINNESHPRLVTYRLPAVATVVSNDRKSLKMAFTRNYFSWRPVEPSRNFFLFFNFLGDDDCQKQSSLFIEINGAYGTLWINGNVLYIYTCGKYSEGLSRQIVICFGVHLSVAKYRWNHPEGSSPLESITFRVRDILVCSAIVLYFCETKWGPAGVLHPRSTKCQKGKTTRHKRSISTNSCDCWPRAARRGNTTRCVLPSPLDAKRISRNQRRISKNGPRFTTMTMLPDT